MMVEPDDEDIAVELSHYGIAALGLIRNLMLALRAKGYFCDDELAAIFEATAGRAQGLGNPTSEKYATAVRQAITNLQASTLSVSKRKD